MELNKYQELASRTLPQVGCNHFFHPNPNPRTFSSFDREIDLLHGGMGLATEVGELLDPIKKAMMYGKPLGDKELLNIKEEAGDALWYIAGPLCRALGCTLQELAEINVAKLKKRYGERYTDHAAIHRDVSAESVVMSATQARELEKK